jgi:hypothetical protein
LPIAARIRVKDTVKLEVAYDDSSFKTINFDMAKCFELPEDYNRPVLCMKGLKYPTTTLVRCTCSRFFVGKNGS